MKIVLASDSFKGFLDALEICQAMADGIFRILPEAQLLYAPMADGGIYMNFKNNIDIII